MSTKLHEVQCMVQSLRWAQGDLFDAINRAERIGDRPLADRARKSVDDVEAMIVSVEASLDGLA